MEANEAQELKEHAEHGAEHVLRPVAFTMSVLAVLVAVTTVMGHRTHTEAVLYQNKATDQWNEYQAKNIRRYNTGLASDLLNVAPLRDQDKAAALQKTYADHKAKWDQELKEDQEKAEALEKRVEDAEKRADRLDLSEAMLEIGLVISSVTLLTRSRMYWYIGLVFSIAGIASAASAFIP
jgi:hypothetical protein